jgi:transcriptional regulator with XRE-family HTH domain
MNSRPEIALTDFARSLALLVGRDKPLSILEVADETGVHDETITNYLRGRTSPSTEWLLTFADRYGSRFQGAVMKVLNATLGPVGFAVVPLNGLDKSITDANGDGKHCMRDSRTLQAQAAEALAKSQEHSNRSSSDQALGSEHAADLNDHLNEASLKIAAARQVHESITGRRVS